jgi:hypothetical protein
MIEKNANPRKQGDAGMGVAIGWFACHGYTVCVPLTDSQRFDLVVDDGNGLKKVGVRTTTYKKPSGAYAVGLRTIGSNMYRTKIQLFDSLEIDFLFAVCGNGDQYFIPAVEISSVNNIVLSGKYLKFKV